MNLLPKCGIYIDYNDVLLLYTIWALWNAETSETCPPDITYGKQAIVIVDNDYLKIDMLTGNATGAHRINMLYMQLESYEKEGNNDSTTAQDVTKRKMSKELDMKCKELTNMQQ